MFRIEPVPISDRPSNAYMVIEVTRRCNMVCDHCLRGEPENIDLDLKYVDKLFEKVTSINTLTLTGGEPSLVPDILLGILELAKKHNKSISQLYIATNGKLVSDEFFKALIEWCLFCQNDDDCFISVEISRDAFHEEIDLHNINKLKCLRFVEIRDENSNYDGGAHLIHEGRAAWNFAATRYQEPQIVEVVDNHVNDTLHMDCYGNIHTSCNLSYATMDEGKFCIGNIMTDGFDIIEAIKTYNLKLESVNV